MVASRPDWHWTQVVTPGRARRRRSGMTSPHSTHSSVPGPEGSRDGAAQEADVTDPILRSNWRGLFSWYTLTESVWNTSSSLHHQPYSYSKTVAEKEAWRLVEQQQTPGRWDLVVVNPSLVMGPGINPFGTSESFNIVKQLGDGTMKMGAPDLEIGVVDVRDLAEAHYQAAFRPEAEGRHIISAETSSILAMGKLLAKRFGKAYDFPKKPLPKALVWLVGPLVGFSRKMVQRNLGYAWKADNSKSKQALGMTYRPVEQSITDFFQQMINHDLVSPH